VRCGALFARGAKIFLFILTSPFTLSLEKLPCGFLYTARRRVVAVVRNSRRTAKKGEWIYEKCPNRSQRSKLGTGKKGGEKKKTSRLIKVRALRADF